MSNQELTTIANDLGQLVSQGGEIVKTTAKETFEVGRNLGGKLSDLIDWIFDSIN